MQSPWHAEPMHAEPMHAEPMQKLTQSSRKPAHALAHAPQPLGQLGAVRGRAAGAEVAVGKVLPAERQHVVRRREVGLGGGALAQALLNRGGGLVWVAAGWFVGCVD